MAELKRKARPIVILGGELHSHSAVYAIQPDARCLCVEYDLNRFNGAFRDRWREAVCDALAYVAHVFQIGPLPALVLSDFDVDTHLQPPVYDRFDAPTEICRRLRSATMASLRPVVQVDA